MNPSLSDSTDGGSLPYSAPEPRGDPRPCAHSLPCSLPWPPDLNLTLQASPTLPAVPVTSLDLRPSPLPCACGEEEAELECSVCYSQFNNVFRCPKVLACRHTFCLECLARINIKSVQPAAIQCPLCRRLTPLPALGLPKLATDSSVLASLPAAMQRVYSVRFQRSKGKLQVKRLSEGQPRWGQRSLAVNHSLHVGLPSPPIRSGSQAGGGVGGVLFRLTGRPLCRALLLTLVLMMTVVLTGIVVFFLTYSADTL
ncbi:RING finger protein 225 [Dunckerocampus dactyliophorus]|uniref:RING finger protein 225 n=1 Tax=Dunckerocampus dactyliophorus TaxID=161453 RepID=UPI00240720E4|nr:RING finger protein 225 [Dunckerocampus dactyliophorus]